MVSSSLKAIVAICVIVMVVALFRQIQDSQAVIEKWGNVKRELASHVLGERGRLYSAKANESSDELLDEVLPGIFEGHLNTDGGNQTTTIPSKHDEKRQVIVEYTVKPPLTVSIITPAMGGDLVSGKLEVYFKAILKQTVLPNEIAMAMSDADDNACDSMFALAQQSLPSNISFVANCTYHRMDQAVARNIAIALSSGDICIFTDADDQMHFQKVQIVIMLFHQNPGLQALTHSFTRKSDLAYQPLRTGIEGKELFPASVNISEQLIRLSRVHLWSDGLIQRAAVHPRCLVRCWIIKGMAPGASVARRSAALIPFICRLPNGALRKDGGCLNEDILWVRNVLKRYPYRDSVLYVTLPLIYCVQSSFWKRPVYDKSPMTQPYTIFYKNASIA